MRPTRWMILAVAVQILFLLGMVGRHSYTLQTGTPVLLKPVPVDPWDMFRGEYVTLRYEMSSLDPGALPIEGKPFKRGQAVWVVLKPGDPYHVPVSVHAVRPGSLEAGQVAVRGTVEWWHEYESPPPRPAPPERPRPGEPTQPEPQPRQGELALRYGIEQFFVPQGEGRGLEESYEDLTVEVKVDRFGRAALSKVFLKGEEIRWR